MNNIFCCTSIGVLFIPLLFGCTTTISPEAHVPEKNLHLSVNNNCKALATFSLENFNANNYTVVTEEEANLKDTMLVEFVWTDTQQQEHGINCYFKKKS